MIATPGCVDAEVLAVLSLALTASASLVVAVCKLSFWALFRRLTGTVVYSIADFPGGDAASPGTSVASEVAHWTRRVEMFSAIVDLIIAVHLRDY